MLRAGQSACASCFIAMLVLWMPRSASAGDMDLTLSRLRIPPGKGGCTLVGTPCPDNEAFERLVSEFATAVAPTVLHGAATGGPSSFYIGLTSALTPISAEERYWVVGTEGAGGASAARNKSPAGVLSWNRLEARKGLPFGFELGATVGQGLLTSMWVVGAELKWALLEGFHSGLGHLPDVAVSGVLQAAVGDSELSLRTDAVAVTLSKPYVIASGYRLVPLASAQLLLVRATTSKVDLTPGVDAWADCDPGTSSSCTSSGADLSGSASFDDVDQKRLRLFVGAEFGKEWFNAALSIGFDATVPDLKAATPADGKDGPLSRQVSVQLALGARY